MCQAYQTQLPLSPLPQLQQMQKLLPPQLQVSLTPPQE
jgi:hypothetical protein